MNELIAILLFNPRAIKYKDNLYIELTLFIK